MKAQDLLPIGARVCYSDSRLESFRRSLSGFGYMRPDPKRLRADEAMEALKAWRGTVTEQLLPTKANPYGFGYAILDDAGATHRCVSYYVQEAKS